MEELQRKKAYYHLPGLFSFYELYRLFIPLFYEHREYFYDWCEIGSIYGAPHACIWGGGRVECDDVDPKQVYTLMQEYGISARLTFSNSLLEKKHLSDGVCNNICKLFEKSKEVKNGVIVHSDLLLDYLKHMYPAFYYVSSTTKVLTDFASCLREVMREDFSYVVPDFRLNKAFEKWNTLPDEKRDKVEFLCNECCDFGCKDRKACYEAVSKKNLGIADSAFICQSLEQSNGYQFTRAMKNPGFISREDIRNIYMPLGYSNFKIEGRGLGSALVLEFLLHYMTKPEYQIFVREAVYLDNMLDLF